jgi:hypothetical protein
LSFSKLLVYRFTQKTILIIKEGSGAKEKKKGASERMNLLIINLSLFVVKAANVHSNKALSNLLILFVF